MRELCCGAGEFNDVVSRAASLLTNVYRHLLYSLLLLAYQFNIYVLPIRSISFCGIVWRVIQHVFCSILSRHCRYANDSISVKPLFSILYILLVDKLTLYIYNCIIVI